LDRLELAARLRRIGVVQRRPVTLRGGGSSNVFFDVKRPLGEPRLLAALAEQLTNKISPQAQVVAGLGLGGHALAAAVSLRSGLPLVLLREAAKDHGLGRSTDGHPLMSGERVAIVDDVLSTGSSLHQASEIVATAGAVPFDYLVILRRGEWVDGPNVKALFDVDDLI
jgi:orotate phosphoribosyltransferase